jgi:pimeloyl-[acyl-carrier protein] methyl ester esterase
MPYLSAHDSTNLYYEEAGKGKPLLFVHGWSLTSAIWSPQKEYFSSCYRCILPDLRGHGRSHSSLSGYEINVFASDLAQFFDSLRLSNVTLVGWSLGTLIALAAYPTLRDRLSSLILVSGTSKYCSSEDYPFGLPAKDPKSLGLLLKRNPQKAMDGFLRTMFTDEEQSGKGYESFEKEIQPGMPSPVPTILVPVLQTLEVADMRSVLSLVREPTLLIHGDKDVICPVDASRFMAGKISRAQCTILTGAGHAPMFSRSEEFNSVIDAFLTNIYG